MDRRYISLVAKDHNVEIDLHEVPPRIDEGNVDFSAYKSVFSDREYSFKLYGVDLDTIYRIRIYVNDEEEDVLYNNDTGSFSFKQGDFSTYCVFKNRFGFVGLAVILENNDGTTESLYSSYVSVLVRKQQQVDAIDAMIDYVYRKQDSLLASGTIGSRLLGDVKHNRHVGLETKIALAKDILRVYKDSVAYFSANCKFKTHLEDVVDDAEKLQAVTPKTLQFIASNPEYLRESNVDIQIRIGKKRYVPQRTLIQKNAYSYDIYENRVVVRFLRQMINELEKMQTEISRLIEQQDVLYNTNSDYIHSAFYIFQMTNQALRRCYDTIIPIRKEYISLMNLYKKILPIKEEIVAQRPMPSAIFLSVAQYNNIYNQICRWFDYGVYDLDREKFMMSFMNTSSLYEVFILAKMIEAIGNSGFEMTERYRHLYRMSIGSRYTNTLCDNTFIFRSGGTKIVLYYQPVIYNSDYLASNGINLYRNNSFGRFGRGSYYYTPDYIVKKVSENGDEQYYIIDAKYSERNQIRNKLYEEMAFKYLISISPRDDRRSIAGLYITYGKAHEMNACESMYDKEIIEKHIRPEYKMIPLAANLNEANHLKYLTSFIGL